LTNLSPLKRSDPRLVVAQRLSSSFRRSLPLPFVVEPSAAAKVGTVGTVVASAAESC